MGFTNITKKGIKIAFSGVLTVMILFVLSSCNNASDVSSRSDTLTIWTYGYSIDVAKEAQRIYFENNKGSNLKLDIIEFGQDDMVQKLNLTLSSGNIDALPDIVYEEDYNLKSYIKYYNNCFVDLTQYIDPNKYVNFKVQNCTYNNKIWAVPYDTGVSAWFYRIDILNQAGYTEKDVENITWDEFISIGKNVFDKTGKYIIPLMPSANMEGRVILQSANSWYYDNEGNLNIVDNQALIDMTETIKEIYNAGIVDRVSAWDDITASIYNEKSAGVIGGSWWADTIMDNSNQSGLWRVTQVPRMSGSQSYTNYGCCGGGSWLVCNTAQQNSAIEFLMDTIATSTELSIAMEKSSCVIPSLISESNLQSNINLSYFGNQDICTEMTEWGKYVPYCNYSTNSYEIAYAHGELIADYLNNKISLDKVIQELEKEAEIIENQ